MVWLIGPDGPWRQHRSFYGVYFEQGPEAPEKFKLIVEHDGPYEQTFGVAGKVVVEGRHVLIQVKYKDSSGHWKKLPVNGRHSIDKMLPDDEHPKSPGKYSEGPDAQPHHSADGSQPFSPVTIPQPLAAGSHR